MTNFLPLFDLLSAVPFSGMALLLIASFMWARRRRDYLWYAFSAGFLVLFLSRLPVFIKIMSDQGATYLNTAMPKETIFQYQILSLVGSIGLWISAIALLVIVLRERK
jgi:hypothetical protein